MLEVDYDQIPSILSELDYSGGEKEPEHALDNSITRLLILIDRLSKHKEFTDTLKLRFDFQKAATILKATFFNQPIPSLTEWGTIPNTELMQGIGSILENGKCNLHKAIADGIILAKEFWGIYDSALAIDIALDKTFAEYLHSVLPKTEYFNRWIAVYTDWLNMKSFVRICKTKIPHKMFWELFAQGGDIPRRLFTDALQSEDENAIAKFTFTEYGKKLIDVLKLSMEQKPATVDIFFRAQLISLYRFTKYCPYGLEILWAFAMTKLEEIGALRTIVRAKSAKIPMEAVKEVISVVME